MAQIHSQNRGDEEQRMADSTQPPQNPPATPATSFARPSPRRNTQQRASQVSKRTHVPQQPSRGPSRPAFSLAGGNIVPTHGMSYIDPTYLQYNPTYRKEQNTPLWGLAKPLPRVVRQGMRRNRDGKGTVEDAEAEIQGPGSSEAIPQVGMINDQRDDTGKNPVGRQGENSERGYGHQKDRRRGAENTVQRAGSRRSDAYSNISALQEKANPMEDWESPEDSAHRSETFEHGDLGEPSMNRLESVQEVPANRSSMSNIASYGMRREHSDPYDIDVEAAEKGDEWPMEEGEEQQYLQEERDMHNSWAEVRAKFREPLAECLATMVAVLLGLCTNLAVQTSNETSGSYQSTNWAWGLGITIGIYIAGGISGGHLNPAISLMLCLYRGFPIRKAFIYITAQVFGAFLAGLIAYGVYKDAINAFDAAGGSVSAHGGSSSSVGLFAGGTGTSFFSQPASYAGAGTGFANEFVATAILACAILALGDDSNAPPGAGMHALIVGLLVTVLSMAFGYNTGACLNPARDLGPRFAAAAVGYGGQVFTVSNAWWIYGAWGATVGGGLLGGFLYDAAIFVGGESPINYPRGKRRKAKREVKAKARRNWWGFRRIVGSQK
ncbi:related to Putative channel protein, exgression is glucose repressed by Mig1 and Mig2 [Rhynchosporium secalis]|uniref:Related to Putative channel protein, exgression is glucose repressed by Mig1 and Mig2 n=1 Tax=Rhynchosporium secalis TaxID=38038 RepID=A0A1E1M6T8_RHYSE|nr:related to Putative channel protein, exgression is glucose repressed by Mig1 and Mig2 [Rhynchosporium secalis]